MINLLIADSDQIFVKNIISKIVRKNERIRIVDIVSSTKEVLNVCKLTKPDIIIANVDIIDISKLNKIDYAPKLLLFTNSASIANSNSYFLKTSSIKSIEKKINEIISQKDLATAKNKVVSDFSKLKFNFSRIGTNLLIESILYSYENKESFIYENLEKNVYPEIAKRHNTTAINVKWVIIKSVNEMYDRNCIENSLDTVCSFFFYSNTIKPTAKIILTTMLVKLDNT